MNIRTASLKDYTAIKNLLDELGYPGTENFLLAKMEAIINHSSSELFVYENANEVVGFIALNFIPQLALEGDIARISYFAVRQSLQNKGVGKQLEAFCVEVAKQRNCNRMEVHCHERRKDAHQFYYRQGYEESPKYLIKLL